MLGETESPPDEDLDGDASEKKWRCCCCFLDQKWRCCCCFLVIAGSVLFVLLLVCFIIYYIIFLHEYDCRASPYDLGHGIDKYELSDLTELMPNGKRYPWVYRRCYGEVFPYSIGSCYAQNADLGGGAFGKDRIRCWDVSTPYSIYTYYTKIKKPLSPCPSYIPSLPLLPVLYYSPLLRPSPPIFKIILVRVLEKQTRT